MPLQHENMIAGVTSNLLRVFIGNSTVSTSAGLSGLTAGSSGLTAYWLRDGNPTTTPITLTASTVGTFTSGGFAEVDSTHMRGIYEMGLPNAMMTAGATKVTLFLQGATSMSDTPVMIDLASGDPFAALTTTTYAQPSAVLSTSATLTAMVGWLALIGRNKLTTTNTVQTVYASDGATVVSQATVTDDGTTVTRGSFV